jgi:hypothetical protein
MAGERGFVLFGKARARAPVLVLVLVLQCVRTMLGESHGCGMPYESL